MRERERELRTCAHELLEELPLLLCQSPHPGVCTSDAGNEGGEEPALACARACASSWSSPTRPWGDSFLSSPCTFLCRHRGTATIHKKDDRKQIDQNTTDNPPGDTKQDRNERASTDQRAESRVRDVPEAAVHRLPRAKLLLRAGVRERSWTSVAEATRERRAQEKGRASSSSCIS